MVNLLKYINLVILLVFINILNFTMHIKNTK